MFGRSWMPLSILLFLLGVSGGRGGDGQEAAKPHRRVDLQGDALPERAVARLGTVRFRHGNYIHSLAYSPDGKLLASAAYEALRVWDAATGKERFALASSTTSDWFSSIAFSPDGKILAAAAWVGVILHHRPHTRDELPQLAPVAGYRPHSQRVRHCGRELFSGHDLSLLLSMWAIAHMVHLA
jgi:WD40 repeat protein